MHQTFYIDIDEEITSVIERLKKTRTKEVIMVVPKRALLIQSIVNLRILKKEVDEMGLHLIIITQDKLGKILIEKVGIFVEQKMDNISNEEIDLEESDNIGSQLYEVKENSAVTRSDKRLDEIGSAEYFDEDKSREDMRGLKNNTVMLNEKRRAGRNKISEREKIVNKELVAGVGEDMKKKQSSMDISLTSKKNGFFGSSVPDQKDLSDEFEENNEFLPSIDNDAQDEKISNFFHQQDGFRKNQNQKNDDNFNDYNLSGKTHNLFWAFGFVVFFVILAIGTYLFLPKATLKIISKTEIKTIDSELSGDTNVTSIDYDGKVIPAKIISANEEFSKEFNATGNKATSNQKARGMITIYNEYNASPQPLVATTRFLSESGKLFRLVKGVTVPGMTSVGAQTKPGEIEAEVIADESGSGFNIEATKFTIPGFKNSGNEKYAKFYAISKQKMIGGGSGATGEKNSIVEGDLTLAKNELLGELDKLTKNKLKESAGEDFVIIEDVIKKEEPVYEFSNALGEVTATFKATVKMKFSTIAVKEKDIKDMAGRMILKSNDSQVGIDNSSIVLDYGKPNANFESGKIDIKFHASGKLNPDIDLDKINKEILGKNEEDLKAYLSSFNDIKEIELNYWPSFINGRIPFLKSRVSLVLDKQ